LGNVNVLPVRRQAAPKINPTKKEAVIKALPGNLQREALAHQGKTQEPADNQDGDCKDERVNSGQGRMPFQAIPS
jgi:hypothetical protein